MSEEQLTIELNDKVYEVNDEMKARIEQRAEREFAENWMLDYYWGANERGDPILYIETEGNYVPWDRLEKLEFEMEEVGSPSGDDSNNEQSEDLDNGNGVQSVPKDDVDMDTPDPTADSGEDEKPPDTKFMVTHPSKNYIPQPEDEDPAKLPPDPDELPEEPTLVAWIPDDERQEVWSTGKSLVAASVFLEWNLQLKADEAVENATKIVPDEEGHVMEVPKTHNHDEWERIAEETECPVVKEKKQKQTPPNEPTKEQQRGYSGREADSDIGGKFGGNNFHV